MSSALDQIDRKILDVVSTDGRATVTAIAEKVGLSKTPCQTRLRRLEKAGYILGYQAVLANERLGLAHVVFVEVKLASTTKPALLAFNEAVRRLRAVEQCHMIAGHFDYLLKVRTADIAEYRRVLAEEISSLPHVAQTSTYVAMETVKEPGHPAATGTLPPSER